jgi:hypothetical protein
MKRLVFLLSVLNLIYCMANSQQTHNKRLADVSAADLAAWLKPGNYRVQKVKPSFYSRQMELSAQVSAALLKNRQWFTDSMPTGALTDSATWLRKMGLTDAEFTEFNALNAQPKYHLEAGDSLTIIQHNNIISFKGNGYLGLLDSLTINYSTNTVQFGQTNIPFSGKITQRAATSPAEGVTLYRYSGMDGGPSAATDIPHLTMKSVDLQVGQLKSSYRIVFILSAFEFRNGVQQKMQSVYFQLP